MLQVAALASGWQGKVLEVESVGAAKKCLRALQNGTVTAFGGRFRGISYDKNAERMIKQAQRSLKEAIKKHEKGENVDIKEVAIVPASYYPPHTLRRCFATYNLLAGMPLNILQKVLGHSRVSTTSLYIKDSDLANLLKEIKAMFIGTSEKLKQKIREFNANSELKRKLGEIISQRRTAEDNISSSPTIIEVRLTLDPQQNKASYGPLNYATRRSAREEIRNKIREANMDLAEVFAAGGEYFDLQPSYYHIDLCLDREEKIREFKNEIMNIVERSVGQFNQRRQQVIDQAKQEAQNKGVQLNDLQRRLNDLIRDLTNIGEQARQERERMTQEEAQAQQDQAQREREEQERREREREERDRQREEELQSEQEERSRETEDNFKFKDAEIAREKEALEQKLDDLKKKLDQPENQDQTDNSDYENEKKDLEKKFDPSPNDRDNNPPPPPSEEPKISTKKAESKLN
ncbi:5758_t:CDS:2 [Racocetra fulgida]|uniref:5758_t:CDS:1 n=1 Tax=Racocetra fulgida TaxID=60492 RepID=A0A9N8YZX2_9GLOM|nr:5758_t:CDS:2 [Racocetra fulgida]